MQIDIGQLIQIFLLMITAQVSTPADLDNLSLTFTDDSANYYSVSFEPGKNEAYLNFEHFAGEVAAESARLTAKKNKAGKWEFVSFEGDDGQKSFKTPLVPGSFMTSGEKLNFIPWEKESKAMKFVSKNPIPKNPKGFAYVYKIEDFTISFEVDGSELLSLGLDYKGKTFKKAEVYIQTMRN